MKNIHVLPTNKPSRVFNTNKGEYYFREHYVPDTIQTCKNYNIYITSDEEIKEGDWFFNGEHVLQASRITDIIIDTEGQWSDIESSKKIILTTDQDLIKDGVQAIDDEFLWWFSENPSCEGVEIENKKVLVGWEPDYTYEDLGIDGSKNVYHNFYKIIIPQGEPKQECSQLGTKELNDLASAFFAGKLNHLASAYFGGEAKQETLEEAAENMRKKWLNGNINITNIFIEGANWQAERIPSIIEEYLETAFISKEQGYMNPQKWFEQFKKK